VDIDLAQVARRVGEVDALGGVSLRIAQGERVALVGPNGSGKSTLLRILMGLVRAEGSVRVGGLDPFVDRAALASRLAYVPQTAPQLGATVTDVVRAVGTLRRIEPAVIVPWAEKLHLDLTVVGPRPLRTLSGGMKQKLLLAVALAAPVSLFIVDEPTASLDPATRETVFRLFRERAGTATLVVSSHRLDEVRRLADRVVVLDGGRIALDCHVDDPRTAGCLSGWMAVPTRRLAPQERLA
jgi:ABC-type multidrug transport system ATPase subunit